MAEEKKYDPMADLNPEYLANMDYGKEISGANQSFSQYGDDSSPEYQQKAKGGLNEKYTGEGVKNDQLNYDESLMLRDLNPNFVYGLASKVYGTDHPGYITQRNDQIASALYNEGKTAKDDVAYFLSQQNGWMNSSEADRSNTIEAIYKRLGQIGEQYPKEEEKVDESRADEIVQDNSGTIYGKNTAEEGNPKEGIDTLSDANSPLTAMEAGRANGLKVLLGMSTEDIATSLNAGLIDSSLQSMRDYQTLYPELWEKVKQYQKKLKAQNTVTSIANGTEIDTEDNGQSVINNANVDFANSNAGAVKTSQEITQDVNNALAQNQTASEASETMASIEEDMAILKNRLKNLRTEANKAFKGDVPDYLVNAYIANKSQEIQNQMSILEDRYNAAYNRYKTEVANTQWEKEYELKKEELQLKKDSLALEKYKIDQGLSSNKTSGTSTTNPGDTYQVTTLSDEEVGTIIDQLIEDVKNGKVGNAQCAAGIQTYYLPKLGITLPNLSSWENKQRLINEGPDYSPKKGDLMIMSSQTSPKYGHIAIVTGVDENGNITYIDWNGSVDANGNGTEKVQERVINADSKTIKGFRNINKGQGQTSGGTTKEWDDTDYANFTNFLDSNNKDISNTDRASIAEMYGFKDNLAGMRDFASEQLKNRKTVETPETESSTTTTTKGTYSTDENGNTVFTPSDGGESVTYAPGIAADDQRLKEIGFDPVLGFNPNMKDVYEKVLLNTDKDDSGNWLANREEFHQREKGQLWQEANAYANAKKEGYDAYNDELRKVDKTYGFAVDKKDVYEDMNKALAKGGTIANTVKNGFIERLGLNKKDENAWQKASDELANYNKWSKEIVSQMDGDLNDLLWAYEYIIMQDATKPQRNARLSIGEADTWNKAYELVTGTEIFDKLINTKSQGGMLTPVSDRDMEMIRSASTAIDKTIDSDSFKDRVNYAYKMLRESIGNPIEQKDLDKMWNQEGSIPISAWINPFTGTKHTGDFSNYLVIGHAHKTGIFGGYNYGGKGKQTTNQDSNTTNTNKGMSFGSTNKPKNNYSTTQGTGDYTSQIMG